MKRHLEKLRAARNEKSARHDYDATAGSSSRSSSTGSVPSGMVGFWGGATLCSVASAGAVMGSHQGGSPLRYHDQYDHLI